MSPQVSAPARLGARVYGFSICIVLPLVGIVLLSVGLSAVLSFAVLPVVDALDSIDWIPAEASIEEARLRPSSIPFDPLDTIEVRYRYRHQDRLIESAHYDPHRGMSTRRAGREAVAALREDPSVTVWVNPADPHDARVRRSLRWTVVLIALPSLVLSFLGALMVFGGMVAWNGGWARQSQ